ncbi:MAG: hypothetical protein L6R48_17625 [Planctomycetes bacterium]|nr:hypothetical protein [Planctomycetota bacterium]
MRRHQPTTATGLFLSWPSGASLLYLLSAALFLGGAALVLAPGSGDESRLGERLGMIGTVIAYQGALLAVALLVCRWRRGHDDAVALAVLLAAFAGGGAAALDTVAYHLPWAALGLGLVGFALCLGAGAALGRRVLSGWPAGLPWVLAALLAADHLMPGLLGLGARASAADPELACLRWLLSWGWLLIAAVALVALAWRAAPDPGDADRPAVLRRGMGWILGLVVAATVGLHQWFLTYAFGMAVDWGDLVPLFALLLWAGELLVWRWFGAAAGRERAVVLGLAALLLAAAGGRGQWHLAVAGLAPAHLILLAGGLLLTAAAWWRGQGASAVLGAGWLALGAFGLGAGGWTMGGLLLAALVLEAARRRSWPLAGLAAALALGVFLVPHLPALIALLPDNRGWLVVGGAFLLLAAGAVASRRSAIASDRGEGPSGPAADAPSIPPAPASTPVSTEAPCIPSSIPVTPAPPASP